jgi:chemotaxis protein MotB
MADQPVIIKKVKKGGHGGHHGGAWKVAYADFVTAMMAFFLLLWLLNSVTQEQLEGISNYFAPASIAQTTSGAGGVLGGTSISQTEGAMNNPMSSSEVTVDLPPPKAGAGLEEETEEKETPDEETVEEVLEKKEQKQFEEAEEELRETIESMPQLKQLVDSLMVDNTPEGMRIQIVDQDGLAMFPRGGAKMYLHTRRVLELVAEVINKMPQKMAISGHTDSVKFSGGAGGYTNWELSADRANASRRALIELGVDPTRLARVVGRAATEPLLKDDPKHAKNRRISIVLLRGTGQPQKATLEEAKAELAPPVEETKAELAPPVEEAPTQ